MVQSRTKILKNLFNKHKYKIAIHDIETEQKYTFLDLFKKIKKIICFLRSKKIKKNDLIVVDIPNSVDFIAIYFACIFMNVSIVPVSRTLSITQKKYIKNFCKPNLILNKNFYKSKNKRKNTIRNFFKDYGIFFTSGTTNKPKAVCHSYENLINNAITFNKFIKIKKNFNFLHFLPMGYMAGFLNSILCPLLAGSTLHLIKNFNIKTSINFFQILLKNKINYFWCTPSLINFLIKLECNKTLIKKIRKNLKMIFVGTAPFPEMLKKRFYKKLNIKCLESYGSTEQLLISSNSIYFKEFKSGKILPGIKCKFNKNGEMSINSKFTFLGYLEKFNIINLKKTKEFLTGDLAKLHNNQYLEIIGRKKNLIIKNGINYSPKFYEEKIQSLKNVDNIIVVGINNTKTLDQKIYAIIELKNKKYSSKIKKNIKNKFKEIDQVIIVKKIPVTHIGKPDTRSIIKNIKIYEKKDY